VSAGEFMMGSDPKKDASAFNAELPRHTVALELYYIGKYPVTVAQFSAFVNRTRYLTTAEKEGKSYTWLGGKWSWIEGANWRHPMGPDSNIQQKLDHPATHISWDDAVAFCRWASQVSGKHVHLPTEAEWEKAARGSVHIPVFRQQRTRPLKALSFRMNPLPDRIYPWGNEPPDQSRCNFSMNVKDTTPVNQYSPLGDSPYGCADMSGNVWEWTSSQYKPYPYQASDGREELEGGGWRVLRGGSFRNGARAVRCVYRDWDNPGYRGVNSGFRVAVTPEAITDRRSQ